MTNFEYACPETEQEAVEFLGEHRGETAQAPGATWARESALRRVPR